MTRTDAPRRRRAPFGAFVAGLVLGLAIGLLSAPLIARYKPADPWIEAGTVWLRLPARTPAGPLPQTFTTPAKAYDYGAISQPLGPLVLAQPSIVRVEVTPVAGRTGVSLLSPDGSTLISHERSLTAKDGRTAVYFRVTPQTPPAGVLVRNYEDEGVAGALTVHSVTYAPQAALSDKQLGVINAAGIY
jgi:hypothetical protein